MRFHLQFYNSSGFVNMHWFNNKFHVNINHILRKRGYIFEKYQSNFRDAQATVLYA
jgi:hypothetical protein